MLTDRQTDKPCQQWIFLYGENALKIVFIIQSALEGKRITSLKWQRLTSFTINLRIVIIQCLSLYRTRIIVHV